MVITFNAIAGHTYRLERATELAEDTDWQSVAGVADLTPGATGSAQFTDVGGANLGRAFYRVGLLP
jgi:hypothetical protein